MSFSIKTAQKHSLQALGLYVWYYCTAETTMLEAVQAFESFISEKEGSEVFQSVYFGLVKLACNKNYLLAPLLEPTAFSSNYLDYRVT